MKKVIIIDDEPLAVSVVVDYLSNHPEFEIVATCNNGFEGLKAINSLEPDLIFLDIQMPKITGFEMLELIDQPPSVIFTTAFDDFAIKAFEANAIDYLLKPFSRDRFDKAILKWNELQSIAKHDHQQRETISNLVFQQEEQKRLVVKSGNNIRIIPVDEILYVEAYDDYIKIHIENDCFLKKQTMHKAEQQLGTEKFLRVHRSFILKLSQITRIEPMGKDSFIALLKDATRIPLSKSGYTRLKEVLGI